MFWSGSRKDYFRGPRWDAGRLWACCKTVVAVSLVCLAAAVPASSSAFRNLEIGRPVPDFTLLDLDGMSHTLSAERGKLVILCFVRPDQDRSIRVLNEMIRINATFKNSGLVVLAVVAGAGDPASINTIKDNLNLDYPILVDSDREVYGSYGLFTLPTTSIIDSDGIMVYEYTSYGSDFEQAVVGKTKVLLGMETEEEFEKEGVKKELITDTAEEKEAERSLQVARVLLDRGFGSKAISKLERALKLDPSLTEARVLLGELYLKEGRLEDAKLSFAQALKEDSQSNNARVGLACVYLKEGDLVSAEAELKKAIALNPHPGAAMYRLGQVYEKKGEFQKAMHTYRDAIESLLD